VEFSKPGWKCQNLTPEYLEYLQTSVNGCREMISPETLENLIQSIPYQIKSVIKAKGYFPLK
jgi:hypothetical protein